MNKGPLYQVLTAAEAAEVLNVTRRQIARLCNQGKLQHRDAPGGLLVLKSSIERYASRRRTGKVDDEGEDEGS
ncbi:helix-turn-helix domain-containing protein [Paenibacillus sp. RUD330]|nr:helix-turn-helix domain-containing protein [Paenibacillus sp. RUD330]